MPRSDKNNSYYSSSIKFQPKPYILPTLKPNPLPQYKPNPLPILKPNPLPQYKPPTFGQSIKDGFGLGLGSGIAHNLLSSFSNNTKKSEEPKPNRNIECEKVKKDFEQCKINENCPLEVLSYFRKQYDSCFEK